MRRPPAPSQAPVPREEPARLLRLRQALARLGQDHLLVSARANVLYLSGFSGSSGYLLVAPSGCILFTDGRYAAQAEQQTRSVKIVISERNPLQQVVAQVKTQRIKRLAFEQNRLSFEDYQYLRETLRGRRFEPIRGLIEGLRQIKSPPEVERIRRSVALNSKAFEAVCRRLRPAWTEARLAAEIEYEMRRLGAGKAAFDTIVASGAHSALPHAQPRSRRLEQKRLILIDQGAILDGYASDMTRMACLGRVSSRERELFQAVREAQQAALDTVRPGVKARSVDRRARQVLRRCRLDAAFTHSTGHGLGLEIHEPPRVGRDEEMRLRAGMVLTIEPGVYLPGIGGVRVEDAVLVTPTGCEVLTPTAKSLRQL